MANDGPDRVFYINGGPPAAANAAASNAWTSVAYGNNGTTVNRFVAVSSNGSDRAMVSSNGSSWSMSGDTTDTVGGAWSSVTWSDELDLFVAVAASGTKRVMTSPDGLDWTLQNAAAALQWTSVTWIGGSVNLFVAVSSDGTDRVMTSENGVSWVLISDSSTAGGAWSSVASNGTLLVAVASSGGDRVMRSSNGVDWDLSADADADTATWTSVSFAAGKFVAVASSGSDRAMTSADGDAWALSGDADTAGGAWTGVAGGATLVVAVGPGALMVSTDGAASWFPFPPPAGAWNSVAYGAGLFVAVSPGGTTKPVLTSPDGVTWTQRAAVALSPWTAITFGASQFVAVASVGPNGVMTSADGLSWELHDAAAANDWTSVTYGNGRYVAVASNGADRVMTSTDGEIWSLSGDASDTAAGSWSSVTFGGNRFVAVSSDGEVMSSTNGTAWTLNTTAPDNPWRSVTYGDGRFVAVASFGTDRVMTSTNGTSWALSGDITATNDASWHGVTFGAGTFVAVSWLADGNGVMTSVDGLNWTSYPIPKSSLWSSVTYHNGLFVAVGSNSVMTSGVLSQTPTITSFDPAEGPVGTTVTITGTNFIGTTKVTFGGVDAPDFDVASATKITVDVPDGAVSGPIAVTNPAGTAVSDEDFTVTVVSDSIRIFGPNEIDTSIEIAQVAFPNLDTSTADVGAAATDADAVVLARNDFFADALAGGPLAAAVNGPLLLTYGAPTANGDVLPLALRDEIDRLINPGDPVYVLGGPLAISADVVNDLDDAGYQVVRVWGENQFGTAVAIADEIGTPGAIFEATGWNFPDALSAVPAAINRGGVILLTNNNVQAPETQEYIDAHPNVTRYTIGGDLVAGGADSGATNVSGQDLYGTSAAVATRFFPSPDEFGVATGNTFPDALSGGVFMATGGRMGPMLLVNGNTTPIPPSIKTYLNGLEPGTTGYAFGGPIAISTAVLNAVMAAVGA